MKTNKHFFTSLFLLACITGMIFAISSCKKDSDNSYAYKYVIGILTFGSDDYYTIDTTITFTATVNITQPISMDSITVTWVGVNLAPQMVSGTSYEVRLPSDTGAYSISLVASADNYTNLSNTHTFNMISPVFSETVKGLPAVSNTFTDPRDGEEYPYKTIGNLQWFVRNLNWAGSGRTYKDQFAYGIIFGRYYSWEEVDAGVCPPGWHVPTNADWEDLGEALNDGTPVSFTDIWNELGKKATVDAKLLGSSMWTYDPINRKENTVEWNAIPSGGIFNNISRDSFSYAYWWSATEYDATTAYYRYIMGTNAAFYVNYADKTNVYFPVRCVQD